MRLFLAATIALLWAGAAVAQGPPTNASVVATCGTPNITYPAGTVAPLTQDTTGLACTGATIAGAVTANSTATASATPTAVIAGTGKPLNISLFSELSSRLSIGGVPVPAGAGTAAAAMRVELPTDGTGKVGLNAGTAIIGSAASAPAASTQISSTIGTGGVFQTALAASATRKGCTLQNTSTHTMSVYVGILGTATTGLSFQVPAGGFFYCGGAGVVVNDAINITTSTTADTYVLASQ